MNSRILCPLATLLAILLAPAAARAAFAHTVVPGESLSSVAAADGLSVEQLAAANGLSAGSQLIAGSTLQIPAAGSAAAGGSASATGASTASGATARAGDGDSDDGYASGSAAGSGGGSSGAYVVQPGDTLSAIAARAGTTVAALAAANGLDPRAPLPAGMPLRLTGTSSTAAPSLVSRSAAVSQPVGALAARSAASPPYPTPERVSPSEVGVIASENGVPPALADAIGYQESGFNNALVSSADARGVMQILPGTWNWIQNSLTPSDRLAAASARDNVRGGVLLLRSLLRSTGGDSALAAAGYYQGLPSVRANGLYPDTQRYVNDVLSLAHRFGGF